MSTTRRSPATCRSWDCGQSIPALTATRHLPVSAARDDDCAAQPDVGRGHHLHPLALWLDVPVRRDVPFALDLGDAPLAFRSHRQHLTLELVAVLPVSHCSLLTLSLTGNLGVRQTGVRPCRMYIAKNNCMLRYRRISYLKTTKPEIEIMF